MQHQHPPCQCVNCLGNIPPVVLRQSVNMIGYALCLGCQEKLRYKLNQTSRQTAKLYFLLKSRGIPAELRKMNTEQEMEIAIVEAKVNIEVDSPCNHYHHLDAIADLKRTYYSFNKGYYTLKIPNALIAYDHDEAVHFIEEFIRVSCKNSLPIRH